MESGASGPLQQEGNERGQFCFANLVIFLASHESSSAKMCFSHMDCVHELYTNVCLLSVCTWMSSESNGMKLLYIIQLLLITNSHLADKLVNRVYLNHCYCFIWDVSECSMDVQGSMVATIRFKEQISWGKVMCLWPRLLQCLCKHTQSDCSIWATIEAIDRNYWIRKDELQYVCWIKSVKIFAKYQSEEQAETTAMKESSLYENYRMSNSTIRSQTCTKIICIN